MAQEIADSTLLDTWGSGGNIVEPDISKIIEGWQLGEQPPHEYMNWLQNTFGSKLNHILKNGVANWNNTTQYLAGSSVQHNGNVWLCKTTNTNSEPADVNANWKRIITVESLADLSDDYVALTGDQTIAGIKTFTSNPLSTATQSTNANALTKYSAVVKNTEDETIAGVKTFSSSPIVPTPPNGDNSTKVATTAFVLNKIGFDNLLHIQDQRPAGTNGQSISAATLTTRDLNTVITNNISGASLSSNIITLPAGTYFIDAKLNMHGGNNSRCTLRNNENNSVLIASTNSQSNISNTTSNTVFIEGLITLISSTVLKISHISSASSFTGIAYNVGSPEIYSDVKIWKVG